MSEKRSPMNSALKYILLLCVFVLVGVGFYTLNQKQSEQETAKHGLQVTTSFYPLYFFASQIGGDKVQVKNITPSGAEPHDYEPTAQDIARIETSDILILNGGVEAWGTKMKENLKGKPVNIVVAGQGLITQQVVEDGQKVQDPHIWLDPQLAKKESLKIAQAFEEKDPENSAYYQANEKSLESKLDALDAQYKAGLNSCKSKDIITSHAAFGYLAKSYNLVQVPIAGLSPDAEPSSQQLADIANFAQKNNVKYIFFESLVSPKLADTIAHEVGAQTLVLDPLEGISEDEIKQGKNYFTVMQSNLKNLQTALQCTQ
jgi:zinc transport system substrate-binding protein